MNKIDLKLIIWGIISALAGFSALSAGNLVLFLIFTFLAIFSMFIVFLAAHPVIHVLTCVITLAGAFFAAGTLGLTAAVLLMILPAFVMCYLIKVTKDFASTLCGGTFILCGGVMLFDRFFLSPAVGGLRVVFSSAIDNIRDAWHSLTNVVSVQSGVDFSETLSLMDGYFYGIKLMLPALIIILAMVISYFVLLASRRLILNIPVPAFYSLRAPKIIAYTYCIGYLFGIFVPGDFGFVLSNAVTVLNVVMMFCGLSLLRYFTRLLSSKALSVIVFIAAAMFCMYIPFILVTAGTFDAIIDFRRRRK